MVDVHAWFAKRPDRPKVATNPRISPGFICTVRTFAVKRIKLDFLFQHRTVYPKEEAAILLGYMLLFNTTWGKAQELGFCGFSRFLLRPCIIQRAEPAILNFD